MKMIKNDTNKITATMKLVATAEFYDDEATEDTLRYCVEQDLNDAGFEADVSLLKEQPQIVRCKDCKWWHESEIHKGYGDCGQANGITLKSSDWFCADGEHRIT